MITPANVRRFKSYNTDRSVGTKDGALTDDQLMRYVPSIFATEAHSSRSARFRPIPTFEMVQALRKEGFVPVSAIQSRTRDETKKDFTKHMVRFRQADRKAWLDHRIGEVYPEMVLVNSNAGEASYGLYAGLFRIACLNGLISMSEEFDAIRVTHSGNNIVDRVIEGTFQVIEQSNIAINDADRWAGIKLERQEALAFAQAARVLRFGDAEGNLPEGLPITAEQMLAPRRAADVEPTLWNVMNRLQEASISGGLSGVRRITNGDTGQEHTRRMTTRPIAGIDDNVKLNRALWTLANAMGTQFEPAAAAA
jgi:Domain of unknown function (DUF932)